MVSLRRLIDALTFEIDIVARRVTAQLAGHPGYRAAQAIDGVGPILAMVLVAIRGNVSKFKNQGKSLAETIATRPTAAYDAKWGQFLMTPAIFTKLVYAGV